MGKKILYSLIRIIKFTERGTADFLFQRSAEISALQIQVRQNPDKIIAPKRIKCFGASFI